MWIVRVCLSNEGDSRGGSDVEAGYGYDGAPIEMKLSQIYQPIQNDLDLAKKRLIADVKKLADRYVGGSGENGSKGRATKKISSTRLAIDAIAHLFGSSGKSLRPALLLLSAGASSPGGYRRKRATGAAAGMVELIHSASLIHDDVIDESHHRRSIVSVHSKFGVKVAILAGDILFSHGFEVLTNLEETPNEVKIELLGIFSGLTKQMCYGEIAEQQVIEGTESIDEYLEIVELKTARLFSVSCKVGSILADGSDRATEAAGRFGLNFGYAYQLADDRADNDSIYRGDSDLIDRTNSYMSGAREALYELEPSPYRNSLDELCSFVAPIS